MTKPILKKGDLVIWYGKELRSVPFHSRVLDKPFVDSDGIEKVFLNGMPQPIPVIEIELKSDEKKL